VSATVAARAQRATKTPSSRETTKGVHPSAFGSTSSEDVAGPASLAGPARSSSRLPGWGSPDRPGRLEMLAAARAEREESA
jgi:hypothetical protein